MLVLKPPVQTTNLMAKYKPNLLKTSLLFGLLLLIISSFTNHLQVTVWANNQPNSNNCGDNLVQLISFCQKDLDTGNYVGCVDV